MVFINAQLWLPSSLINRRNSQCYRLVVSSVTSAFEYSLNYPGFIVNFIKCRMELNRKVFADLAIYEPKT
ncbi:unnamed protein product [Nyctereutes procyonoides]|uniref:(raccoon dog) hypothetical protein n=1 Tax=Nyctereutes procyonoides TaxID=34880 RepID=A0A811Z107_NYCPR|nr:unnamed protein product [Nyctereutes procyonoides]